MQAHLTRWLWLLPAVAVVVLVGSASPAAGQEPGPVEPIVAAALRQPEAAATPPPEGVTTVGIDVYINEILDIDERANTFQANVRLSAEWVDKRTTSAACAEDPRPTVYDGEGASEHLKTDIWSPGFYELSTEFDLPAND